MKIKEMVDICHVSGLMSNNSYRDFINNTEDMGIELRDSEIELLKRVMKCDGHFRKALHALRNDYRKVYKDDRSYDKFIGEVLEADKKYDDTQFRTFILGNMIRHSEYFIKLKNPSIEFFKIIGQIEDNEDDRVWFNIQDNRLYPRPYYYGMDYSTIGQEVIIPEIKDMYMINSVGKMVARDIPLIVLFENGTIKLSNSRYVKTKKDIADRLRKVIRDGLMLFLLYDLTNVVEIWNMEVSESDIRKFA